ncbi:MAG: hypothetical protein P4L73_19255 [Caulobacteraceae bacterium]|nr:hypothetical protein [Caulobacteraceae bacterium]
MTTTAKLVRLTVEALRAARTDAGDRVYSPGDWPTKTSILPVLLVQARRDDKVSQGRGSIAFTTTSTVRITGRVDATGAPADAGGEHAEDRLWRLQRQAERAVINADGIAPLLQQFPTIRTEIGFNSEGQLQLGEFVMEIAMEYFQGPEDFFETPTTDITGFDVTLPQT